MKRNPYIRIVEAAAKGKGVVLSPEEVLFMRLDSCIETAAAETSIGNVISNGLDRMDKHGIVGDKP